MVCGIEKNEETWNVFLVRELTKKGFINNEEIELIIKIKTLLNRGARVKYVHNSEQLNTWKKTIEEIKTGNYHYKDQQTYTTDFNKIIKEELKMENWAAIDWENVFYLYQIIIKRIIFAEFFCIKID